MTKIRVLVVDDSALVRKLLQSILESDPDIEVVGTAPDPFVARERIKSLSPDVLTLDVEMPRMDGITFLKNLMRLRPMPVVMVSTLTEKGAGVTLDALEIGAIDFVAKPKIDLRHSIDDVAEEIVSKVKAAARAKVRGQSRRTSKATTPERGFRATDHIVAIGASTGGTEAIRSVLSPLPADAPGIVIAQHIPEAFSGPFARRLNEETALSVAEAEDGQQIIRGHVLLAPGGKHLEVVRSGARFHCRVYEGERVNRHMPSVSVLLHSVSQSAKHNAVGVMLTGMGSDGADGLLAMRDAGAITIAQDEASSVVWGMPGSAVKLGAADSVLPLDEIPDALMTTTPNRAGAQS